MGLVKAGDRPSRNRPRRVLLWTVLAFRVVGVIFAIDAIMSTRTATGAIGWTLGLVAAPVVAVPAYLVLGRSKFEGYIESRREHQQAVDDLVDRVRAKMGASIVQFETPAPAFDAIEGLSQTRPTHGNKVELLIVGQQTFDSIFEGIRQARDYVLVEFYIVHDDGLGRRLKDAMIERARAGVDVVFL